MCTPPCRQDQYCDNIAEACRDLPAHVEAGTITFSGLKVGVALTPDEFDRYNLKNPPADGNSRVRVILLYGMHDPATPDGILCEAADDAGQLAVPVSLTQGFRGYNQKFSFLLRFTQEVQAPFGEGKEIEMTVGSLRRLSLLTCPGPGCL